MKGEFKMNFNKNILTPFAALLGAALLPTGAFASSVETRTVAVQTEIDADEVLEKTDIIYEAVLANAAAKTLDANKDWFRVLYREAHTKPVTRNISSNAESRYLDLENGDRIELEIPTKDVTVQVQKIDFEMGTGPAPKVENAFVAKNLILADS
jgi:hypothetical protein